MRAAADTVNASVAASAAAEVFRRLFILMCLSMFCFEIPERLSDFAGQFLVGEKV
jgi:hypothetical protein